MTKPEFIEPCAAYEALITEVLFGTPTEEDEQRLAVHTADCQACAGAVRQYRDTLAVMTTREQPMPPADYWETYYDRLAERMAGEAEILHETDRPSFAPDRGLRRRFPRRYAYQAMAALMLIVAGVVLGRFSRTDDPAPTVAVAPAVTPVALETRTQAYLDRSKVLLLGLVNFDATDEELAGLDLSRQQEVAHALLKDGEALQDELAQPDQEQLRRLMADLELILLQIANLEAGQDLPAIELIQRGIDRRGVLLKINLTEMHRDEAAGVQPAALRRPLQKPE